MRDFIVENASVYERHLSLVIKSSMVLLDFSLNRLTEFFWNFHHFVIHITVVLESVPFKKFEERVAKASSSWTNFYYIQLKVISFIKYMCYVVTNHVSVVRFVHLWWSHPCVRWVFFLQLFSVIVKANELFKGNFILNFSNLIVCLLKISLVWVIKSVVYKISSQARKL